jgi:hypothetical protein
VFHPGEQAEENAQAVILPQISGEETNATSRFQDWIRYSSLANAR